MNGSRATISLKGLDDMLKPARSMLKKAISVFFMVLIQIEGGTSKHTALKSKINSVFSRRILY